MTSSDALERMAAQVLHPARSTEAVNLTTLGAEVAPSELMAAPGFIPDAVADVDEIGGTPTHEELVREVFEMRQNLNMWLVALIRRIEELEQRPCPEK